MNHRRACLYIIIAINIGVAILVDSGAIVEGARLVRDEFRSRFFHGAYYRFRGGFTETLLATTLLIPNLVVQNFCVRIAICFVSPRLTRCTLFRRTVWLQALYLGLPLILAVFAFDLLTCFAGTFPFIDSLFVGTWFSIFLVLSTNSARLKLRARAIGMGVICVHCGYSLVGSKSDRCPECGRFRIRSRTQGST